MESTNTLTAIDIIDKLDFIRDYLQFVRYIDAEIDNCKVIREDRADKAEIFESGKIAMFEKIAQEFDDVQSWLNRKWKEHKIS